MPPRRPNLLSTLAAVWFPLALVLLLLLALPGVVLFVLLLLGAQGWTNTWLQENFSLTYHLPLPWWAGLLLLLVPFLIMLLYFLKLKRRPLQVPSTFLWRKSIEDLHVNSLFQWLRHNVLLLLQVLAVLGVLYAVMAFRLHGATAEGKHYVLMIDNSASMSATDVAPSRLHQARADALRTIDAHAEGDVGMVIVFSASAEILQSFTADRGLLRSAVQRIEPTQRPTRLDEALSLADSLANPNRSTENEASRPADEEPGKERTYATPQGVPTELHLFSDGRFPDVPGFALGNLNLQYHAVGPAEPPAVQNVGLAALNALRDELDPSQLQAFVSVLNYNPRRVRARVQLEVAVDGAVKGLYEKELELPPFEAHAEKKDETGPNGRTPGEGSTTFNLSDVDDRADVRMHARLRFDFGEGDFKAVADPFALDDEAWLVAGVVRKSRVLVVTAGNRVLEAFFNHEATSQVARVQYLGPADLAADAYRQPARAGAFDLVVFDRCAPATEEDLPLANTYFIDAVPPPWKKADMPKLETPRVRGWLSKHPLLRYLTGLHEIGLTDAFRFDLKDPRVSPRTPRLLETDRDAAVLFALGRQSFTDLVQTFALINDAGEWVTNWPLQPSFPLFLRNVLYTLGNVSDAAGEENVQPGQPKTLRPDAAVAEIEVVGPREQTETLTRGSRADFVYGKTDHVGVYQVRWGGATRRSFEVNLFDAQESDLQPRPEINVGAEQVVAGATRGQPRELWKWLALAALVLLLLEWYVYNRRVYI